MNANTGKVLLVIFAFLIVSCASTETKMMPDSTVIHTTIASDDIHEDCTKAMPGQKIVYTFESSMPLSFNIHYHDDGKVTYAVYEPGVSRMGVKTYNVEIEQYYCLMWKNTSNVDVRLSYSYKLIK